MRKSIAFTVLLSMCFLLSNSFAQELIEFKINGPKDKRINIVIVGDGYTEAERSTFEADMQKVYDAIVSDPMLERYIDYHNFYGMFKASAESGADNSDGCGTNQVNTAYDSKYCTSNVLRLLTSNNSKIYPDLAAVIPEYDQVMVVVNASRYGGSGGSIAVSSASSPEIIAHEIGHSFPNLKDEYETPYTITPVAELNVTDKTTWDEIHWNYWIEDDTPLPTPETAEYGDVVGVFEGAAYQPTGWYRPELNCRMRSNGIDLCAICAEIWALEIHEYVSPIDSLFPTSSNVVDPTQLSVKTMPVKNGEPHLIQWFVDGVEREEIRGLESWSPAPDLEEGDYEIWVKVTDTTAYVRQDPKNLMEEQVAWQVSLSGSTQSISTKQEKLTFFRADRNSFSWKASNEANLRLYSTQGHILADFQLKSKEGSSQWPRALHPGHYYVEILDDHGVERRKLVIK